MTSKVFSGIKDDKLRAPMFFGEPVSVQRYDVQKYPFLEKATRKQISFFWVPEEIAVTNDKAEFAHRLTPAMRRIWNLNLQYQILMDSSQSRGPLQVLLPHCSLPELETWIITWSFFETIHSRSYTHIIRSLYDDPSEIFDQIIDDPEILSRARAVTKYYDEFEERARICEGFERDEATGLPEYNNLIRSRDQAFLRLLYAICTLEGVRFYVSFACSWAFSETMQVLTKPAKILQLICRDENIHLGTMVQILKAIKSGEEGDYWKDIHGSIEKEIEGIFLEVADQERAWCDYLFRDGSIIGLNAQILKEYVEHITDKRLKALGFKPVFHRPSNPIPWTEHWISSKSNQPAPQEQEFTSYVVGGLDKQIDSSILGSIDL